ncbi:MAG: FkbM family methyltransferase [Deltaproteobacteria bacterium]|nr:FkbM family methyltransferase [Deltaproteobacteria bacterium]
MTERPILKTVTEKALLKMPALYVWLSLRRKHVDKNKLVFLSFISKGQVVLDVGANFGFYTRLFSNIVGPEGKVIAFEPVQAAIVRFLVITRARNNIELVCKGLGASESRTKIYIPAGDLGQSSLARHAGGSWKSPEDVREEEILVTTLDKFVEKEPIKRIDFVKVDIEGGEAEFLYGAENSLKRFKPLVYTEVNHGWLRDFGESPLTVAERFSQLGYCFVYEPRVMDKSFRLVQVKLSEQTNGDFLFATSPCSITNRQVFHCL